MSLSRISRSGIGLRARLTLLFVVIFGATLILYSWFLYRQFIETHERELDSALFNYTVDVARSVDVSIFGEVRLAPNSLNGKGKVFPFALGDTLLELRGVDGEVIARSPSLGGAHLPWNNIQREQIRVGQTLFQTLNPNGLMEGRDQTYPYRMVSYLIEKPGSYGLILQVAVPMVLLERERRGLIVFFAFGIPSILLLAALGGLYLSQRALAPVRAIISKSKEITALHLSERVPVPRSHDEIRELAQTLNELLNRLEQAFRSQESFIADASHQLKTPLSILRGEIDLMRSGERSEQELSGFLTSASQEIDHLSRTVEDLLILARMDTGRSCLSLEPLRLDEALIEVIARMEKVASQRGVRISLNLPNSLSLEINGDPDLIRNLIANLLDNAIKYSPEGGQVFVELAEEGDRWLLRVRDQGSGIPSEVRKKVFDRFFRSESTRDKISGSGLGLAIARRIAEVHGGTIRVGDFKPPPDHGAELIVELRKEPELI